MCVSVNRSCTFGGLLSVCFLRSVVTTSSLSQSYMHALK